MGARTRAKRLRTGARGAAQPSSGPKPRRWSHLVTTVSTFPPAGTFTGDAASIARTMARKDVSPKGIASGIRMIQFFINRAGRKLPAHRRRELEKAKRILQARLKGERRA